MWPRVILDMTRHLTKKGMKHFVRAIYFVLVKILARERHLYFFTVANHKICKLFKRITQLSLIKL